MKSKTAMTIIKEVPPPMLLEMRVYHSGMNNCTTTTNKRIGKPYTSAMGKPRKSLLEKLDRVALSISQLRRNCSSFSVIMLQN